MLKHQKEEQAEEQESGSVWLTSYSDMVTNLLAVFVLLFSFALLGQKIPKINTSQLSLFGWGGVALMEEGGTPDSGSYAAIDKDEDASDPEEEQDQGENDQIIYDPVDAETNAGIHKLMNELSDQIAESDMTGRIGIEQQSKDVFIMRMADSVLFDTGSADITPAAREVLNELFGILEEYKDFMKTVRIEGHTDDRPMNSSVYPSNWELSSARALNVLKVLLNSTSLDPSKLAYTGYAEFRPIAENDSPENMAKNRRVDFVVEMIDALDVQ